MSSFHLASLQYTPSPRTQRELDHDRLLREERPATGEVPRASRSLSWLRFVTPRFGMLSEG